MIESKENNQQVQAEPPSLLTIEAPGPLNEIPKTKPVSLIDWTRPVRLTGFPALSVRIICIDHNLEQPVVGAFNRRVHSWNYDGGLREDGEKSSLDLENVPEALK